MRSAAHIKGHPLHPMLIAFPVALLPAGLLCDLAAWWVGGPRWTFAGGLLTLAGIISAVAAAVPGLIDYLRVVPPNSSGKKRATYHMVVNLSAVGLFAIAWAVRGGLDERPGGAIVVLELLGTGLLTIGGWLGGTLVYRNMIAVDHRYAGAGKWKEASIDGEPDQIFDVASIDELQVGQMMLLRVAGRRVVLARTDQGYRAFDDHCTHRGGSLAGGVLVCDRVQCLWHGSQFDTATGQVASGPAAEPIHTYPVEHRGGRVHIRLEPQPALKQADPRAQERRLQPPLQGGAAPFRGGAMDQPQPESFSAKTQPDPRHRRPGSKTGPVINTTYDQAEQDDDPQWRRAGGGEEGEPREPSGGSEEDESREPSAAKPDDFEIGGSG